MYNSVVIKGSKSGMSVFLDPEVPFEQLLEDVSGKFKESAKFWGCAQMVLTLEGRTLTPEEEYQVVNVITSNSSIDILCLVDTNAQRIQRCEKALNEKLMDLSAKTGQFYKGNLRSGEVFESETSVVIIGDVEEGAKVIAKGNVVVLGQLCGSVCAGVSGNTQAVVVALDMAPLQLRIGDCAFPCSEKKKRLSRGTMVASVEKEGISMKTLKKRFFHVLNSI